MMLPPAPVRDMIIDPKATKAVLRELTQEGMVTKTWEQWFDALRSSVIMASAGSSGYVIGDLIYADTAMTLGRLAAVAVGSVLVSAGVATPPAWSATPVLTSVTAPAIYGSAAANGDLAIYGTSHATKTTSYVTIQPTGGFVGIGMTTPVAVAEVAGAVDTFPIVATAALGANQFVGFGIRGYNVGTGAIKSGIVKERTSTYGVGKLHFLNSATLDDTNATLSDARMTIRSSGLVGIGTTDPASVLEVRDGLTTTGSVFTLGSKEPTTVANDILGRINFYAPLDSAGSDANLLAASIVAIAEGTFSATNNATTLSFRTGASEVATEKMKLSSAGVLTLSGNLAADGGITVDTTNFTVNGTTGAVHAAGDFDVATTKFTVAAATGNTLAAGTLTATGAFGCNAAAAQTAYASGGALAAYGTGAFGYDSAAHASELHAMVVKLRAALVANGVMS